MKHWIIKSMVWMMALLIVSVGLYLLQPAVHATDRTTPTTIAPESQKSVPKKLPEVKMPHPEQPKPGLTEDTHLNKTPVRQTQGLDLVKLGWTYNCMDCHKLLRAQWHYTRPMVEHTQIKLTHGANRFCLNCHHPTNRNAFVDYDGAEIAEMDVVQLCAKCHGPTHRDWKAGIHGRRNGYWNTARGPQSQLKCIQCHDPHQPKFLKLKPLPPPTYPERAAGKDKTAPRKHGQKSP